MVCGCVCVLTCEKNIFPSRFEGIVDNEWFYFCHDLEARRVTRKTSLRGVKIVFMLCGRLETKVNIQSHVGVFIDKMSEFITTSITSQTTFEVKANSIDAVNFISFLKGSFFEPDTAS